MMIALMSITMVLFVVGIAGGPVTLAAFLVALGGAFVMGTISMVMRIMRDDISGCGGDVLLLEAAVAPGTTFDRDPFTLDIGDYKGKYEVDIRWVTA